MRSFECVWFFAKVSMSVSDRTIPGHCALKVSATGPPIEKPTMCARSMPSASRPAFRSFAAVSVSQRPL